MNIFTVDLNPVTAAKSLCDKHITKMSVETTQMLVSALRRHGATDSELPLTKAGTPHKGGYAHHPCTVWTGDTNNNFYWLLAHGLGLVAEYTHRYGKQHACEDQLWHISSLNGRRNIIPKGDLTDVALAVGGHRPQDLTHAPLDVAVEFYRQFYCADKKAFAKWDKDPSRQPNWW